MKRRDMIKLVSLRLFNEEGETNLAAIDIANELDISPGNLYYHFKGKEELIDELLEDFSTQMVELINLDIEGKEPLLESWLQLYVMLELIYEYRFLFRNISDMEIKYPKSGERLVRLVRRLANSLESGIDLLAEAKILDLQSGSALSENLARNILLVLLYWDCHRVVLGRDDNRLEYVQGACLQVLALISPYLDGEQIKSLNLCHKAYLEGTI